MDHSGHEPTGELPATPSSSRKRTGGRSARVRQAVLKATLDQLASEGIEGLTISEVAARAGVAETTIYRRWGTRTALVADAVTELAAVNNPVPDTGTLRGDLHQLADQISHLISHPGIARLLASLTALSADQDVATARRRFWDERFELTAHAIRRASERGELPEGVPPRAVLETLSAPLYFRLLVVDQPLERDFIMRCIDQTIAIYSTGLHLSVEPTQPAIE
ncbi:TetR/AcrR family transcriptional regulator [Rhodococcus erythropolis]|uniref:TetR/AcrR family transcriptional regulator n=1 Tax=Rhodococcus erythropolis TaxID=1833 RepID=UPI001BECEDFA|nr:TetR/AcrR family transcriptional regulator [Rhodococcus erythropolis]MBT2264404.1 TetR/AcrR family transcriptional regulator [Rhodococcus erythropolis]